MGGYYLDILKSTYEVLSSNENALLTGLSGTAKSYVISKIFHDYPGKLLCLVANEEKAYDLARYLDGFIETDKIYMFLGREFVFIKDNLSQIEVNRILTLQDCVLYPDEKALIIATPSAFMYLMMPPEEFINNTIQIEQDEEYHQSFLLQSFVKCGYSRVDTVTRPGEFAVRGGIVDIFPVNEKNGLRIEFFGDFVESIRYFDIDTQRSDKKVKKVAITPADELLSDGLTATLFDYIGEKRLIIFDEPREFYHNYDKSIKRFKETVKEAEKSSKVIPKLPVLNREELKAYIDKPPTLYHSFFSSNIPQVTIELMEHIAQQEMEPFFSNYELFYSRLKEWQDKKYDINLAFKNKTLRERLKKELTDRHISGVNFLDYSLEKGFVSSTLRVVFLTEVDLQGRKPTLKKPKKKETGERLLVEDLKLGDYVVHENYGIGIFRGVTSVEVDNVTREYVVLEYAAADKLYLPLEKLDVLYKYSSSEEKEPRLSKLGGTEWERTKKKVSESIQELAEGLLKLYATREATEGYAFSPDTPWQREFEAAFPYEETPDQLKAIEDVKRDMEQKRPMDRLICGDVGYGKTEVAMRAAFKAIMDGKQVAVLVPTTVLAKQHYQSFKERFENYPAVIECLNRFRSTKEQKRIIADLKKGVTDLVIGTHRLLSKDIEFKDLGLLIIDEEHRFGVAQKEKIKSLKETVDVISLSATPIPRTLHMSLTGLRDLSIIDTPPPERYPITTYVMEYNEEIIYEAVMAEIERGGQVFFVHNRIEDIYRVKEELEKLFPTLKIAVGHGRMKESELAPALMDFIKGKYHIFLCTTIIESGLDIPNVNTIIVDEADKMGLAQLYQLRGRVGRSNRAAYAYLTYRPDRILNETAQKRLNAIREFSELGSGIKIAERDLEIRGAGNILGPEQHGYIYAVGFDLYCRLLEEETARLKGVVKKETLETQIDVDVDYYIPDSYIPDSGAKMRIYRRLLLAADKAELDDIKDELIDRFGNLPKPVENFLQIAELRILAQNKEIKSLRRKGKSIEINMTRPIRLANLNKQEELKGLRIVSLKDHSVTLQGEALKSLDTLHTVLANI
ncbi:MAG: transcription-repair coupling factor [Syntrophomonadaceae bacterium]|nr:transcription-repair coupling factor [Syntrophomonadaceae bacterium]